MIDWVLGFNPTRDWVKVLDSPNPCGEKNQPGKESQIAEQGLNWHNTIGKGGLQRVDASEEADLWDPCRRKVT